MFGTAACSGSAIPLYSDSQRPGTRWLAHIRDAYAEQSRGAEPLSSGGATILPCRDVDSGIYIRAESSICTLRFGDCVCVAGCLALYPAGRALGSGLCLAPTASD